jgi:hypothetical protein
LRPRAMPFYSQVFGTGAHLEVLPAFRAISARCYNNINAMYSESCTSRSSFDPTRLFFTFTGNQIVIRIQIFSHLFCSDALINRFLRPTTTMMRSFLLLVALSIPSVYHRVEAAGSIVACDGPCKDRFEGPCDVVVSDFNFQGDCCTLQDIGNDNCMLTVGEGSCTVSDRIIPCDVVQSEDIWFTQCEGNFMVTYESNTTEEAECSESQYELKNSSENGMASEWIMEVMGVDSLNATTAVVWKTLMEKHTLDVSSGSMGDLVSDVQTYIHPYILNNTNITADDDGVLRLEFFQYLTWRNEVNFTTLDTFMEQVYLTDESVQMLLAALQTEYSNIVNISFVAPSSLETEAPTLAETMAASMLEDGDGTAVMKAGPKRTDNKGQSGAISDGHTLQNGIVSAAGSGAFEWTLLIVTLSVMALA